MPIQIIPRRERPDAGDAFAKAIMGFLEAREENKQKLAKEQQFTDESQELQKHFANQFQVDDEEPIDFTKIQDPSIRKSIVTEGLKAKGKDLEFQKIKEQFPDYFKDEIIPTETPPDAIPSDDISVTRQPKKHSESEILRMQAINPGMAHQMREENKQIQKQQEIESKEKIGREKTQAKEAMEIHKESKPYYDNLIQVNKSSRTQYDAANRIEKSVKSGKINPLSISSLFKHIPKVGDVLSKAVMTKDQATLKANLPFLLEGWKEIFGVRLSDKDLNLLLDKLPDIDNSKEANLEIARIIKHYSQLGMLKYQIGRDIKKKGGKLRQHDFEDAVEEEFDNQTKLVDILSPDKKQTMSIPKYLVPDAQRQGFILIND